MTTKQYNRGLGYFIVALFALLFALIFSGCVSLKKYNTLKRELQTQQAQSDSLYFATSNYWQSEYRKLAIKLYEKGGRNE